MTTQSDETLIAPAAAQAIAAAASALSPPAARAPTPLSGILPSDCGCGGGEGKPCSCGGHGACSCGGKSNGGGSGQPQLVYALGTLDVDFGTEARRDAFIQAMDEGASPHNPEQLAAFLAVNPIYEQGLTWVLRLDASPIYAIKPVGTYARETAERLREIYRRQFDQNIEIISVPGYMAGQARLLSGIAVPVIYPDARGLYAWDVPTLAQSLASAPAADNQAASLENFLNRVYYEFRNLGVTPQERAMNYSATNAFQVSQVFGQALGQSMALDGIAVEKSPICRPESDCWDVVLTSFRPDDRMNRARMSYRFTVDVSDVLPVLVGPVRSWAIY
jgi:cyanobactin maturation PatA/PatG family protease